VSGVADAQTSERSREPGARREMRRGGKDRQLGQPGMRRLFRGIALTDAERTNLAAVGEKYRGQLRSIRESMRPDVQTARAARQRGDTAAARAALARTADEREQLRALTDRMHADARAALAPEHRAQFDANVARMKERMAKRAGQRGPGRAGKAGRRA